MNIVFVGCEFSYPNGSGATARVEAFAKGLRDACCQVHVLCVKPSDPWQAPQTEQAVSGVADGIPFEYTCGRRITARTRPGAAWLYGKGLLGAMRAMWSIHRKRPIDVIFCWGLEYAALMIVARRMASRLGAALVLEKDDYPSALHGRGLQPRIKRWWSERISYKFIDGLVVISSFLENYYTPFLRKDARMVRIPIMVDSGAYAKGANAQIAPNPYVMYCGNLNHDEEIFALLRCFAQAAGDFPQWKLRIIGGAAGAPIMDKVPDLLRELRLEQRVEFLGLVNRNDIPARLLEGGIMVLPRMDRTYSQAGFPTKLAEYLATGRPVVVTATGEIPRYIRDGENGYLVSPGDEDAFAQRLRYVMLHPEEADEVGRRGRELAYCQFDYRRQCQRLLKFFRELQRPNWQIPDAVASPKGT